jgi:enoyl-CoA hydratase
MVRTGVDGPKGISCLVIEKDMEGVSFGAPEMGIGLFPDVGGGWYLSRPERRVWPFLALTGARLDGAECLELGLATHYLHADVIASLDADDSDWAMRELATLRSKSPQTCKVALRQLAESAKLNDFADNMRQEYRIAARVLVRPDFAEGVRAVIVDKDNAPKWNPATPEGVTEDLLDAIFAPLPTEEEWKPL